MAGVHMQEYEIGDRSTDNAYYVEYKVLALTNADREAILRALDKPPETFAELRGVLLGEHVWCVRDGLV